MASYDFEPEPDARAVAFLQAKGLKRSWRWASLWKQEHAFGFTLAGVHRLDVLAAAQQLTTQAVAKGETLETFKAQFEERLKTLGFHGPQLVTEFDEGPRRVELSAPNRMRVIYDTNVRQAYAAAEWQAIEDTEADFPALEYQGVSDERTREDHRQWFGMVFPVRHAFWKTHYPPNDWFCRCYVIQVSIREVASGDVKLTSEERLEATGYVEDPQRWAEWRHAKTGRTDRVPEGVAPGFSYNAGMARRANLGHLLERRVEALDPDLARAAAADLTNLPVFADLVEDAVQLGQARAAAASAEAARLKALKAEQGALQAGARAAADRAGVFRPESWPVGVAPAEIADLVADAPRVVVANASAIGHAADRHPTRPADWRRVQAMLETGSAWWKDGELLLLGSFAEADAEPRMWALALKPVQGAWRVRTMFPTSLRRVERMTQGRKPVRAGAGTISWRE